MFEGFGSEIINMLQMLVIHYNQFSILTEPLQKATKKKIFQNLVENEPV